MNDERGKILERIQKLLRMAGDVSSPNEAAIAARRAKALMTEYNISHAEALSEAMSSADFREAFVDKGYKAVPKWKSTLSVAIANYSDTQVVLGLDMDQRKIQFRGEKTDLAIAEYLYVYLVKSIEHLAFRSAACGTTELNSYKLGCVREISATLIRMKEEERGEMGSGNGKALVLVQQKQDILAKKYGIAKYHRANPKIGDRSAYEDGRRAGAGLAIRRGVGADQREKLK